MNNSTLRVYAPERETRKSGNPTRPGNRSTTSQPTKKRKRKNILKRAARFYKRLNWKGRLLLGALVVLVIFLLFPYVINNGDSGKEPTPVINGDSATAQAPVITEAPEKPQEYIFRDGDGQPVDWEGLTNAWAAEAGFEKRYTLTDAERWEIASVITAEAEGEPYAGKVAVAQCILQSCEDDGIGPFEVLTKYKYSRHRPDPCEEALEAVQDVFDFGHVATTEPIKYFYAPARVVSDFHESQGYVMTINGHKFFKEATE